MACEERNLVWQGAIPLQLELHNSEVTILPPPPPLLILAPRNGYLPLLVSTIKPHFQSALPIGQDTGWFEYEGLPLKWQIPTGVLFDLLCFELNRPWNIVVHFRGYPSELLPYEGEDAIKWNFINALKEASYVIYGSTKHVMNLSQSDQLDLWKSVAQGDVENYDRLCLKMVPNLGTSGKPQSKTTSESQSSTNNDGAGKEMMAIKIPFRLYVRTMDIKEWDSQKVPPVKSWNDIVYITRPVDAWREDGTPLTLWEALVKIAPRLFALPSDLANRDPGLPCPLICESESLEHINNDSSGNMKLIMSSLGVQKAHYLNGTIRIQGIEPSPDLPIDWLAKNLLGPDHFVHVSVLIASDK